MENKFLSNLGMDIFQSFPASAKKHKMSTLLSSPGGRTVTQGANKAEDINCILFGPPPTHFKHKTFRTIFFFFVKRKFS